MNKLFCITYTQRDKKGNLQPPKVLPPKRELDPVELRMRVELMLIRRNITYSFHFENDTVITITNDSKTTLPEKDLTIAVISSRKGVEYMVDYFIKEDSALAAEYFIKEVQAVLGYPVSQDTEPSEDLKHTFTISIPQQLLELRKELNPSDPKAQALSLAAIALIEQDQDSLPKVDHNEMIRMHAQDPEHGIFEYVKHYSSKNNIPEEAALYIVLVACKKSRKAFEQMGDKIISTLS